MRKMITSTNEKELQDLIEYGGVIIDNTPIYIQVDITGDGLTDNDKVIISKTPSELTFDFSYFYGKNIVISVSVGTNTLTPIFILPAYCDFNISNASSKYIALHIKTFQSPIFLVDDSILSVIRVGNSVNPGCIANGFADGRFSYYFLEAI